MAYRDDAALEQLLFRRMGRGTRASRTGRRWRLKRKGVTLSLLWQEYRAAHPDGYTWFCDAFRVFERRTHASWRNRHEAGAVMQTDYAGQTVEIVDRETGEIHEAQIFVAVLGASSYTFATASLTQRLPDWIAMRGAGLLRWRDEEHCLRQPEGGGGEAALVRADAQRDLRGGALRHHRPADAPPKAPGQGEGRGWRASGAGS